MTLPEIFGRVFLRVNSKSLQHGHFQGLPILLPLDDHNICPRANGPTSFIIPIPLNIVRPTGKFIIGQFANHGTLKIEDRNLNLLRLAQFKFDGSAWVEGVGRS